MGYGSLLRMPALGMISLVLGSNLARAADAGPPMPAGPLSPTVISRDADLEHRPHVDLPGGVIKLPGVTYSVLDGYRPLTADLFVPPTSAAPHPIVVYIHGGGWSYDPMGEEGVSGEDAMAELARRGYVVVRPAYRLTSEAIFPAQLIDVKTAIRWIKTYAPAYHADPSRVVVWGDSAGGNLAALVGTTCGQKQFDAAGPVARIDPAIDPKVTSCVGGVVDWFGPTDFAAMASEALPGATKHDTADAPEAKYLGCEIPECSKAKIDAANPGSYVAFYDPPYLIIHGMNDVLVPYQQSQLLNDALRSKGNLVKLVFVPGAGHMFRGASPQVMRAQLDTSFKWIDEQMHVSGN